MTLSPSKSQTNYELQCVYKALKHADCDVVKIPKNKAPFELAARSKSNRGQTWAVKVVSHPETISVEQLKSIHTACQKLSLKSIMLVSKNVLSDDVRAAGKELDVNLIDGEKFHQMISELPDEVCEELDETAHTDNEPAPAKVEEPQSFSQISNKDTSAKVTAEPEPSKPRVNSFAAPEPEELPASNDPPPLAFAPPQVEVEQPQVEVEQPQVEVEQPLPKQKPKPDLTKTNLEISWVKILIASVGLCFLSALGVAGVCHFGKESAAKTPPAIETEATLPPAKLKAQTANQ